MAFHDAENGKRMSMRMSVVAKQGGNGEHRPSAILSPVGQDGEYARMADGSAMPQEEKPLEGLALFAKVYAREIKAAAYVVFLPLYAFYFAAAIMTKANGEYPMLLIWLTGITAFCWIYTTIRNKHGRWISERWLEPAYRYIFEDNWRVSRFFVYGALVAFAGTIIIMDAAEEPERLVSLVGLFFYVGVCWTLSVHRTDIKWKPVIWGFAIQFALGAFIMRTVIGFKLFEYVGNQMTVFLGYSDAGAAFVFGESTFMHHQIAFAVLPTIIFFSSFISICYYFGWIQVVILKISWVMQRTLGTSAGESLNAAGNIFVGQTEAPLLIKPLLPTMTKSEIHAVMTGGFATIAGGVLAVYVKNGVSASHLISASVMSAPAALAVSKIMYPETEESPTAAGHEVVIEDAGDGNCIEAAARGASEAVGLVGNVAAMLISFLSLLAFLNALLGWIGTNVGYPELSFEIICSYLLTPLAFAMGVRAADCKLVALLLGQKTFVNEFIAYMTLSQYIKNRLNADYDGEDQMSARSEIIVTYALCGFANVGSIGIQLGGLIPLAPERAKDISSLGMRAMIAGTIACFMTACVAGVLYKEDEA